MHLASLEFYYVSLKDEYRKRLWYCSVSQIHVVDAQTVNLECCVEDGLPPYCYLWKRTLSD